MYNGCDCIYRLDEQDSEIDGTHYDNALHWDAGRLMAQCHLDNTYST